MIGRLKNGVAVLICGLLIAQPSFSIPTSFYGQTSFDLNQFIQKKILPYGQISETYFSQFSNAKTVFLIQDGSLHQWTLQPAPHMQVIVDAEEASDKASYIQAVSGLYAFKKKTNQALLNLNQKVEDLKKQHFSDHLYEFYSKKFGFDESKIGISEYALYLDSIVPAQTPNLKQLVVAATMEKSLDFKRLEEEQEQIWVELVKTIPLKELKRLHEMALAFERGEISYVAFLDALKNFSHQAGIYFSAYLELNLFLECMELVDEIDAEMLGFEILWLEEKVKNNLVRTREQREILSLVEDLHLLKKMANHSITENEWNYYIYRSHEIKMIQQRLKSLGVRLLEQESKINIPLYEKFYSYALARLDAKVGLLVSRLSQTEKNTLVFLNPDTPLQKLVNELRPYNLNVYVVSPGKTKQARNSNRFPFVRKDRANLDTLVASQPVL